MLSIMLVLLVSVGSNLEKSTEATESSYRVEDLMDAIDKSLALDREQAQCPPSSWNKSLANLVADNLLGREWLLNSEFTPSVIFRTITTTSGTSYQVPAFSQVAYRPLNSSILASLWKHQLLMTVNDREAIFVRAVNTDYSTTSSYINPDNGCAVN